jgi:hypothetical protein
LESFLGLGAGDLEAVDATHQVVKRWENILFLSFYWAPPRRGSCTSARPWWTTPPGMRSR